MPNYCSDKNPQGKVETPTTDTEFAEGIEHGTFKKPKHRAYAVLLFYTAVRKREASRTIKEDFTIQSEAILWNVGPRFKKNKYLKVCPDKTCGDKNSGKALYCKKCGKDISQVTPELIRTKTVTTTALTLPLNAPHMNLLKEAIEQTKPSERVFPYSPKTCYNIIHRVWHYPHLMRLTRITWFLANGWTNLQVKSWTGLSLAAIDYYAGLVTTTNMGMSMGKPK